MPGENAAQGVATTANPAPRSCLLIAGDSATLLQGRRCCNLLVQAVSESCPPRNPKETYNSWAVDACNLNRPSVLL